MINIFSNWGLRVNNIKLITLMMIIILINLSGCSTTHRYKTLSFFFDGVPNPDKGIAIQSSDSLIRKDTTATAQNSLGKIIPQMYFHPPYKEKECSICHDQTRMGKYTKPQPELCYQCHDDFGTKFKVLHGPVGGGQCVICHSPHQSMNANLLLRQGQAICLYCHNSEQVMAAEQHQDIKDASCMDCHNPHGGDDKFILN
jgi:predicted CXXCH cytochrome family protein